MTLYHAASRTLQERFDTQRLAERIAERLVRSELNEDDQRFIARQSMFFLATSDPDGFPQCSYKGGDPGFVCTPDRQTLAFPSYDGNGMYLSAGNVLANPRVGLLFIDFEAQQRLRVNGVAHIEPNDPLLATQPEAQFIVRVAVAQVFPNCPRYVHRMQFVEASRFVPRANCTTPVPDWKRRTWSREVLASSDPALALDPLE